MPMLYHNYIEMKKGLFYFALLVMVSCSKEPILSCDPMINAWALENVDHYEYTNRSTIVEMPLSRARAILRGLSVERKMSLWQEKYELVKEKGLLSKEELEAYKQLIQRNTKATYTDIKVKKSFLQYAEQWSANMKSSYGWNDEKLFFYTETWMLEEEYYISLLRDLAKQGRGVEEGDGDSSTEPDLKDCNCLYDMGCPGLGYNCDKSKRCKYVDDCGLLGHSNCKGLCSL